MFECGLLSPPRVGSVPDMMQTGIEWLDLGRLAEYRIYPSVLRQLLRSEMPHGEAIYLGEMN